jgi:hypothetical protein
MLERIDSLIASKTPTLPFKPYEAQAMPILW